MSVLWSLQKCIKFCNNSGLCILEEKGGEPFLKKLKVRCSFFTFSLYTRNQKVSEQSVQTLI